MEQQWYPELVMRPFGSGRCLEHRNMLGKFHQQGLVAFHCGVSEYGSIGSEVGDITSTKNGRELERQCLS